MVAVINHKVIYLEPWEEIEKVNRNGEDERQKGFSIFFQLQVDYACS